MSGWENLPDDKQATPPAPRKKRRATVAVAAGAAPGAEPVMQADSYDVEEGAIVRAIDWYFPAVWLGILAICCFIGIYYAVHRLPDAPW